MIQIKHNKLRIPTGGRLTSLLFTQRGGVEFGATEDKTIQRQGGGFEPGTSGLQVQRPNTRPRLPPPNVSFYKFRRSDQTSKTTQEPHRSYPAVIYCALSVGLTWYSKWWYTPHMNLLPVHGRFKVL